MGRQTGPQGGAGFRMLRAQFWILAQSKCISKGVQKWTKHDAPCGADTRSVRANDGIPRPCWIHAGEATVPYSNEQDARKQHRKGGNEEDDQ